MTGHDDARDEIRFHLEQRAADLMRAGLSAEEAHRRARAEFGDVEAAHASLAASAAWLRRRARRRLWRDEVVRDIRYGARQLRASPGFAAVAVLTLALGAGATAAIYSVVDAVLLRSLPWTDEDRLVAVWESHPDRSDRNVVSRGNFMDWRDQATSFDALGAYMTNYGYAVTGDGPATYWTGAQVTPSLFGLLGVVPMLGRVLAEDETDALVLSEGLWRRRYGADPAVLGRTIRVEGSPYTIVGVLPPRFDFPSAETEFWLPTPLPETYRQQRQAHTLHVVGRLREGVTPRAADAAMDALARRIATVYPVEMEGWSVNVVPLRAELTAAARPALLVLLGAVGLVLLMACANVANLQLARATARGREVAVRSALGAGRARLIRQFLTESALLGVLGGALGMALAVLLLRALVLFGPGDVPFLDHARLDVRVFAVTLAVVGVVTVLIGWLPAVRATRTDVQACLREESTRGTGGVRHQRARHAILAAEVALSVVLLVTAGLLVRSLLRVQAVDSGYADDVVLASISLPGSRAIAPAAFFDAVLNRLAAVPGVVSAAGTSEPPVVGFDMTRSIELEHRPDAFDEGRDDFPFRLVTPGWFELVGVEVVSGRSFMDADRADAPPVAIVNRALAGLLWRGVDPVGGRIRFGEDSPWVEIVGVVEDVRHYGLERAERPALYAPYAQKDWAWLTWMTLAVRGAASADAVAPALREAVRAIDADIPVQRIATIRELYSEDLARRRFQTALVAAFAAAALLLGSIGIYGVASYGVTQRADELRVRLALGARRAQVIFMIVRQQLVVVMTGAAIGLLGALAAARLVASQLFGVTTIDAPTFAGAVGVLGAAGLLATWLAARRAARGPLRAG